MIGKLIRLERIINRNTGRTVIVPMDHGVSVGPVEGLIDIKKSIDLVAQGGANAVVVHKGIVSAGHRGKGVDVGLIIHLSGSSTLSPSPNAKTLVCSVEEAMKLGADAVSIHINVGDEREADMLDQFGAVSAACVEWGMPLLAMCYPRGPKVKNEYDPDAIAHAARLGAELGADIVKCPYTGSPYTFRRVVEGCFAPVVIAGGPKMTSEREIMEMVSGTIACGAIGLSIGRNVFQHNDPPRMVRAMSAIVHDGATIDTALGILGNKGSATVPTAKGETKGGVTTGRAAGE
ncbi:MAG: 2-amino-3,7-dideoxy-D-threo-hept-6-ulosonate synthase [Pseudomonadota bacterium]